MSVCPKCNTNIDEDFGLVDCSGCGVSVLIGIDGDVQVASVEPDAHAEIANDIQEQPAQDFSAGTGFGDNVSELNDEATNFNFNIEGSESAPAADDQFGFSVDADEAPVDEPSHAGFSSYHQNVNEDQETNSQAMVDEFTSFTEAPAQDENSQHVEVEATSLQDVESEDVFEEIVEEFNDEKTNFLAESEIAKAKEPKPQSELVNLSEYANSKKSSLKDGYLKYKLFIGGIDTKEIKDQVFEELADRKLLLDLSELSKKIVDGNLCIEPISAVKASILVNRLKSISVTIAWDQYDIRKA